MIKYFCDICGSETNKRINVHIEAKWVYGNLADVNYECCQNCYNELLQILNYIKSDNTGSKAKKLSIFKRLKEFVKK